MTVPVSDRPPSRLVVAWRSTAASPMVRSFVRIAARSYRSRPLFTANVPQCVLDDSLHVTRLFPDFEPVERDYYRRTAIFPIMHTIVLPRELVDAHPGLAPTVYRAFLDAKDAAADRFRRGRRLYEVDTMIPWMNALFEENRRLFPTDWWPYGVSANRATVDTFLRYHYEQGLSRRRWTVEEVFAPELLGT